MLQGGVAEAAVALWQRAFPELEARAPTDTDPTWALRLGDQEVTLFDSPMPHDFGPTPAWSFMVDCAEAEDVDRRLALLSEGGKVMMPADSYDFAARFAWVEDRFGISWQLRHGGRA